MTDVTPGRRLLPVFIGIAMTALFLVLLAYLADRRRNAGSSIPSIDVLQPAANATVDSPLVIRFITTDSLRLQSTGWGAGQLHLHARVNGVEHMPGASEIVQDGSVFVWTLASVRKGSHTLRLGWANQAHRELAPGSTSAVRFTLR